MVEVACPLIKVTPLPRLVAPSLNCTVPVGVLPVTTAVIVSEWPAATGLALGLNVTLLAIGLTTCETAADVLAPL